MNRMADFYKLVDIDGSCSLYSGRSKILRVEQRDWTDNQKVSEYLDTRLLVPDE